MSQEPKPKFVSLVWRGPGGAIAGVTYPFRALMVLKRSPQLRKYVVVPILVNLVVGATLYAGLLYAGFQGIDGAIANLPEWAMFLSWLLRLLLVFLLLLGTGFLLLQFGVILGSPWYGKLSEELERLRTGNSAPEALASVGSAVWEIWRAILFELKKLVLTLVIGLPLLLLNFWPGVGTVIASIGGVGLAVTIICLDFFDPALERRRLRFRQKLGIVLQSLPGSATFGLVCLGLISIPGLNLLAIPLCVTAGTLFCCDRVLPHLVIKSRRSDLP